MTGLEDGFTGAGRKVGWRATPQCSSQPATSWRSPITLLPPLQVEAEPAGFDAGQYSFFGDLGEDEGLGGLDGALEVRARGAGGLRGCSGAAAGARCLAQAQAKAAVAHGTCTPAAGMPPAHHVACRRRGWRRRQRRSWR